MARFAVLAQLICCLCRPVAANAQAPTFLDQVVIKETGARIEIRHPTLDGTADKVTFDQKAGHIILTGNAKTPAEVTYRDPKQARKTFRGKQIVISLKDGSIEEVFN